MKPLTDVAREALAVLNALSMSEIGRLHGQVDRVRATLDGAGQEDLATRLEEGQRCLRAGDPKGFRRAVSNVTARLGHLK